MTEVFLRGNVGKVQDALAIALKTGLLGRNDVEREAFESGFTLGQRALRTALGMESSGSGLWEPVARTFDKKEIRGICTGLFETLATAPGSGEETDNIRREGFVLSLSVLGSSLGLGKEFEEGLKGPADQVLTDVKYHVLSSAGQTHSRSSIVSQPQKTRGILPARTYRR